MAQNYFYPPSGGGSSANASVGPNGAAIPGSSTLVAGKGPTGLQTPLATDSSGDLFVVQASGATDNVNLTQVGGTAVSLGAKVSASSFPVVLASDEIVPISATALPLPTGASTSALQTTGNSSLSSILANQTNGTQVTTVSSSALPTGAATSANQTNGTQISKISQLPQDVTVLQSNIITTQDIASSTSPGANGQTMIIGTATTGSTASVSPSSDQTLEVEVQGIWTGTLQFEVSGNNAAWIAQPIRQVGILTGSSQYVTQVTSNFIGMVNVSAETQFRVRAISAITGSVTVRINLSVNQSNVYLGAPIEISSTSSLPLPSGAATSANQATEISSLSTIATNTTGVATAANQTTGNTSLATIATNTTGVSTAALQTSGNSSLSTIVTNTTRQGTLTDGSTNTSATPGTSTQVFATNAARKYLFISNPASNSVIIFINFTAAASTSAASSIQIVPGGSFVMEASYISTEAVNIACGTASIPFTAKQG